MQIRFKGDTVEVEGYVNAIERKSKPLNSRRGKFVERICKGAFKKALERNANVRLLLNHDWSRDLGGTSDGTLELTEDNIGLKARATISDEETVKKARNGELVGWSFGFQDVPGGFTERVVDDMPTREVKDLDLYEVSLLDKTKTPAYDGTLVSVRADDEKVCYTSEPLYSDLELREETQTETTSEETTEVSNKTIDYSKYDSMIKEFKEE